MAQMRAEPKEVCADLASLVEVLNNTVSTGGAKNTINLSDDIDEEEGVSVEEEGVTVGTSESESETRKVDENDVDENDGKDGTGGSASEKVTIDGRVMASAN